MNLIQKIVSLGYEKHSGFSSVELDNQPINSVYKQLELFLIQKWFREHHNLHVYIEPYESYSFPNRCFFNLWIMDSGGDRLVVLLKKTVNTWDKYEEALHQGLIEALKIINKE